MKQIFLIISLLFFSHNSFAAPDWLVKKMSNFLYPEQQQSKGSKHLKKYKSIKELQNKRLKKNKKAAQKIKRRRINKGYKKENINKSVRAARKPSVVRKSQNRRIEEAKARATKVRNERRLIEGRKKVKYKSSTLKIKEIKKTKKNKDRDKYFSFGLGGKYISYNGKESFNTGNRVVEVSNNNINPEIDLGLHLQLENYFSNYFSIFVKIAAFTGSKNNIDTGISWQESGAGNIFVNNELRVLEAFIGEKLHWQLPKFSFKKGSFNYDIQHNLHIGGQLGYSRYDFSVEYLSNNTVRDTRNIELDSLSLGTLLGYEILLDNKYKFTIDAEYITYQDLRGIENSINLSLNYAISF